MLKFCLILLGSVLLGRSGAPTKTESEDAGYFAAASDCFRSSELTESIKVPTGNSMTIIEIPMGDNADNFRLCMQQSGYPSPKALADYLDSSRTCLHQARHSSNPDTAYAKCMQHSPQDVKTNPQ